MTQRINEEKGALNRSSKIRCVICGSPNVMAEINGKYYCAICGAKIVKDNVLRQIENWRRAGLIPEYELNS